MDKKEKLVKRALIDAAYKSDLGFIESLFNRTDVKKEFLIKMKEATLKKQRSCLIILWK
ncbi:hypothetical protein KBB27_00225 [Patescibacteria group bacterium]|nr:hypothetical protein [Patescibacteria group bacterium]